jgi:hypothetical protein
MFVSDAKMIQLQGRWLPVGANSFAKQAEGLPCGRPWGNCAALGE